MPRMWASCLGSLCLLQSQYRCSCSPTLSNEVSQSLCCNFLSSCSDSVAFEFVDSPALKLFLLVFYRAIFSNYFTSACAFFQLSSWSLKEGILHASSCLPILFVHSQTTVHSLTSHSCAWFALSNHFCLLFWSLPSFDWSAFIKLYMPKANVLSWSP